MSNKKRIHKKIQSIESKKWFREVSFIINEGFPDISKKSREVAKAFSDFAAAAKIVVKIIARSGMPVVKIPDGVSFNLSSFPAESNKTLN